MGVLGWIFGSAFRYRMALGVGRRIQRFMARGGWIRSLPGYGSGWTLGRDLQELPEESFREWWRREKGEVG